jgi:GNAT superfamily N-acetyltransferase
MQRLSLGAEDLTELAAEILECGGRLSFRATGSSMWPTLRDGDLLTAVPAESRSIRPGDVLLYRAPDGRAAVHRVAAIGSESSRSDLMLSCDARPWATYGISGEQVLGAVVSAVRDSQPLPLDYSSTRRLCVSMIYMLRLVRSAIGKVFLHCLSAVTFFKPARRCLRYILRPLVKYEMTPREQCGSEPGDQCTWDLFQASVRGRVIGSAQLVRFSRGTPFSRYQWLFSMRVNPLFRGGGIGRRLTEMIMEQASHSGEGSLCLIVATDNRRAIELYESIGFTSVELSGLGEDIGDRIGPGNTVMIIRFRE